MNQEVVSFVLRFIREEGNGEPARWRGVIKHVQSDDNADFARFGDALQFMQTHVDDAIRQAFSSGDEKSAPENMFAETARLWGEMAPRYTDIMLQSMEVMLEQGRRMGETFAESLANNLTTQQGGQSQQSQILAIIERLAAQVEALSSKVDDLETRLSRHE